MEIFEKYETAVVNPSQHTTYARERERLLSELNRAKTPWRMLKIFKQLKKLESRSSEVIETPEGR